MAGKSVLRDFAIMEWALFEFIEARQWGDAHDTKMMHEKWGGTQNYVFEGPELFSSVVAVTGLDEEAFLMEGEIDLMVSG